MERVCLKWNDFKTNVSNTFRRLKDETDFFDVTLVTEDEKFVTAHKVVLSASSEFFKNILKKADHSKPMIYLNEVEFKELSQVIDYIYEGETNIYQEDLDTFLGVAKKLKIEGLTGQKYEQDTCVNDFGDEKGIGVNDDVAKSQNTKNVKAIRSVSLKPRSCEAKQPSEMGNYEEAKKAVDKIVMKVGKSWVCKTCDKTSERNSVIRRHAETHIDWLSFPCNDCNIKPFGNRVALSHHKTKCLPKRQVSQVVNNVLKLLTK